MNLCIIGHVDSGKSTLMGHMLLLWGKVTQQEFHRNKREAESIGKGSFYHAFVLDSTDEEK